MNWQAGNQQERLESYLGTITFFYSVFNHKYLIVPFLRGTFFMFLFFITAVQNNFQIGNLPSLFLAFGQGFDDFEISLLSSSCADVSASMAAILSAISFKMGFS